LIPVPVASKSGLPSDSGIEATVVHFYFSGKAVISYFAVE